MIKVLQKTLNDADKKLDDIKKTILKMKKDGVEIPQVIKQRLGIK